MPSSGESWWERLQAKKRAKQEAASRQLAMPEPAPPPRRLLDRERVSLLLDHLIRYRESLVVLWLESDTDLPFELWVESLYIRSRYAS